MMMYVVTMISRYDGHDPARLEVVTPKLGEAFWTEGCFTVKTGHVSRKKYVSPTTTTNWQLNIFERIIPLSNILEIAKMSVPENTQREVLQLLDEVETSLKRK